MIKRNRNFDIIRSFALLMVLIYHFWVLTGSVASTHIKYTDDILKLGGEIGVTLFFMLSGYGIFCSLYRNSSLSYKEYILKRAKRILPEYYICFFLVLLLTDNVGYLTMFKLGDIVSHLLLIHNFFPNYAGSINGVLWTMGVIFDFYLIAPLLYKLIIKNPYATLVTSFIITILFKYIVFNYIYINELEGYNFFFSRQLIFSTLDNFVIGMFLGYIINYKMISIKKSYKSLIGAFLSILYIILICEVGLKYGIHSNNISGYLWHSELAISISVFMYMLSNIKINFDNVICKMFLWLSKYEYSIYLWHLILVINFVNKAPIYGSLLKHVGYIGIFSVLLIISIFVGYLFAEIISTSKFVKLFDKCIEMEDKS